MLQVSTSRPGTQQSLSGRLPEIQHPLSRLGNPATLDVRGVSRNGFADRPLSEAGSITRRPLANERDFDRPVSYRSPRRSIHTPSEGRVSKLSLLKDPSPRHYEAIPEGVEVTHGDPGKTRLPVFGNRAGMASRGESSHSGLESRLSSRLSRTSAQLRLEIDELEMLLREKMKTAYTELKKRFRDNDPEQKGNVSRDALHRILVVMLNKQITTSQFKRLLERLSLQDKAVVSVAEFYAATRQEPSNEYPLWMDPVTRQSKPASMTAAQVHAQLKEKAKQKVQDMMDMMPRSDPDGTIHILKPELRSVLNRMGFSMSDAEFDKLWDKYDTEGIGTTSGEKIMQKLGILIQKHNEGDNPDEPSGQPRGLRKKEKDRQRSLDIERWLKSKFREGCSMMKTSFQKHDPQRAGLVSHDNFLAVLADFGLRLEKEHLAEFMARCTVQPTNKDIPYIEFLHRFQDRSEHGMTHKIMANPRHRYNKANSTTTSIKSTFSALEAQLMNMFQTDFLSLLGTFHKIDRLGLDVLSQEEFRAAIESKFGLEMTDDQFRSMLDRVPLDEEGNVRYADFMAQFDTKGEAPSLFAEIRADRRKGPIPALPKNKTPLPPPTPPSKESSSPVKESTSPVKDDTFKDEPFDAPVHGAVTKEDDDKFMVDMRPRRTASDIFSTIKTLLKQDYQAVEAAFQDLDTLNTRRISQEMMYQLLKKFHIEPEITRGEIRDIWKTFITNSDKTLEFLQFVRHFGYSIQSAAFPSAKVSPPKKGDSDFMMRSRKLNCARDMIHDSLRSKIDYMWEDLRREFTTMDPYQTGCVSAGEFRDVLQELCVHLSDYELDMLTRKFSVQDGRVSYIEFLKPYALKKQIWRYGNDMISLLKHSLTDIPAEVIMGPPRVAGLEGVTMKVRQKVQGDWKYLRRAFKKLDTNNSGYVTLAQFRSVLKLSNITLTEDEVYQLMSRFDENMTGKVAYNKFLSDTFTVQIPPSRESMVRHSAEL